MSCQPAASTCNLVRAHRPESACARTGLAHAPFLRGAAASQPCCCLASPPGQPAPLAGCTRSSLVGWCPALLLKTSTTPFPKGLPDPYVVVQPVGTGFPAKSAKLVAAAGAGKAASTLAALKSKAGNTLTNMFKRCALACTECAGLSPSSKVPGPQTGVNALPLLCLCLFHDDHACALLWPAAAACRGTANAATSTAEFRTKTCKKTDSPAWNEELRCVVDNVASLLVSVFNADGAGSAGDPKLIGSVDVRCFCQRACLGAGAPAALPPARCSPCGAATLHVALTKDVRMRLCGGRATRGLVYLAARLLCFQYYGWTQINFAELDLKPGAPTEVVCDLTPQGTLAMELEFLDAAPLFGTQTSHASKFFGRTRTRASRAPPPP